MNALPLRDFLTDVGYHPLFWSIAFLPLFLPILAVVAWCGVRARVVGQLRFVAAGLGAVLLAALGLAMWTNLRSEAFPDHVQPAVASIAALFQRGAPIYHELTAIICTSGTVRSHIGIVSREFQVPCVMGCTFSGEEPPAGAEVELDCSGDEAVVRA